MLIGPDWNGQSRRPSRFVLACLVVLIGFSPHARAQGKAVLRGQNHPAHRRQRAGGDHRHQHAPGGRYLGKHIPGNPAVIVQNMPGGGGLVAAYHLFNVAKPDGLTIAAISRANDIEQMVGRPEVRADFRKFNWIGSFNKAPMMATCRSDTEYKSIAAHRAARTPPRFGQSGTGSISYVFANLIERILDIKIKKASLI